MTKGWTIYPPSAAQLARSAMEAMIDSARAERLRVHLLAQLRPVRRDVARLAGMQLVHVNIEQTTVAFRFSSGDLIVLRMKKEFHFRFRDGTKGVFVADSFEHDRTVESLDFAFLVNTFCKRVFFCSRALVVDFENGATIWVGYDETDFEPIEIWGHLEGSANKIDFFHVF